MKKHIAAAAAILACGPAMAAPAQTVYSTRHEVAALIGLQWNFSSSAPELVLGARATSTKSSDRVNGVKFDIAIPLSEAKWTKPTVRVLGVVGNRDVLGEAGVGYSFAASSFVLAAGVQGPFVNAGVNYLIGSSLMPYIGVNSFNRPRKAKKTTPSSPT
jgi:hypothetical protein